MAEQLLKYPATGKVTNKNDFARFSDCLLKTENSQNWFEKKDLDFLSTGFDTEFSGGSF